MTNVTALKTWNAVGDREDLTDYIGMITRHETPLYSGLEKVKSTGVYHEWQIDTLSTGSTNAQKEGDDYAFSIPQARTRTGAYNQIFTKTLEVSGTQNAVAVAGLDDEFAYQMDKRMKEIATDIEKSLVTGTGASGASGTARELKGIFSWITTTSTTGTGTGTEYLTETMYNDTLQSIWAQGGRPDKTYVNGFQKRKISSFATSNTRYLEVTDSNALKNTISVYESDFGRQQIELDPFMDADKVACLQTDMWKIAVLRGLKPVDVATVGDAKRGALVTELTLQSNNEAASGEIIQLLTA